MFACQTLDGAYWHFYDGNNNGISDASLKRAKTVVNLVKTTNPNRPYGSLNVQNTVRGYPATNCAMAGREGNGACNPCSFAALLLPLPSVKTN